jgi:hypothetical protein
MNTVRVWRKKDGLLAKKEVKEASEEKSDTKSVRVVVIEKKANKKERK